MNKTKQTALRIALLLSSGIFISLGISQNQHSLTLEKAIRICLECIGIG